MPRECMRASSQPMCQRKFAAPVNGISLVEPRPARLGGQLPKFRHAGKLGGAGEIWDKSLCQIWRDVKKFVVPSAPLGRRAWRTLSINKDSLF
jgi:hypothetical protein